jgi:HSP20 family protein
MANLTRFDPFNDMISLRQAMDRLFEDSFVSPLTWRSVEGDSGLNPALDVHQTANEIVVSASLAGVQPEDVQITLTGQTLQIRGEFKANEEVKRDQYLYRERRYGTFNRQLQLPVRVQGEKAQATFENGVLSLRIPKAEDVKPKQIQIKAGASEPVTVTPTSGNGTESE